MIGSAVNLSRRTWSQRAASALLSNSETEYAEPETSELEAFDPKIPSSCPMCRDFQLEKLPKTEVCDSQIEGVFETRVMYSFKSLGVQSSRGCLGCKILHDAIRSKWTYETDPGQVRIGFVEGKRAVVYLASGKDGSGLIVKFYLYSSLDKPSPWDAIGKVPIASPLDVLTEDRRRLLDSLLKNCLANHARCKGTDDKVMPRRLIDVGDSKDPLSLSLKEEFDGETQYVTLSHCWQYSVSETSDIKLLRENIIPRKERIPWEKMSKTFQDAIKITRWFNIRYIWIDSLCIVQDDKDDWAEHSSRMADIYENAYFTIACEFATDGKKEDGCFLDREGPISEIKGQDIEGREFSVFAHRSNLYTHSASYKATGLWARGWCIQERVLSRRLLRFQPLHITFECAAGTACECTLLEIGSGCVFDHGLPGIGAGFVHVQKDTPDLWRRWCRVVEEYSIANLTHSTDRLPAMSGIASRMPAAIFGNYIAGLWSEKLLFSLTWWTPHQGRYSHRDKKNYVAPSFSWMSVFGRCRYDAEDYSPGADRVSEVVRIQNTPLGRDPRGQVEKCCICLRARFAITRTGIYANRARGKNISDEPYKFDTQEDWENYCNSSCDVFAVELFRYPKSSPVRMTSWAYTNSWALLVVKSKGTENAYERVGCVHFESYDFFREAETREIMLI